MEKDKKEEHPYRNSLEEVTNQEIGFQSRVVVTLKTRDLVFLFDVASSDHL